ncbi:hypothetical protein ACEZ3G_15660 [Maribacter algicola]|uniref:Uncharacterized protein n=1 Tax=Meishania litoralis TaxID=3434685 RepID=A0ACC7LSD6_9FLAO
MRQKIVILIFAFIVTGISAQEGFKIGAHGGIPIGEFNDRVGLVIGADVGYMWAPNKIFDLGIKAGIVHGFGEQFKDEIISTKSPSIQFAPVAASVRIWPMRSFSFGGDIGQAFGLSSGNDGGLYLRPQIGFQTGAQSEINFSYSVIQLDNETWSTVTMGFVYTFLSARHFR